VKAADDDPTEPQMKVAGAPIADPVMVVLAFGACAARPLRNTGSSPWLAANFAEWNSQWPWCHSMLGA
jgi:hypothetical protein